MVELVAYNVGLTSSELGKKAIQFLSNDSFISGGSITLTTDMTISFYFKPQSLTGSGCILSLADDFYIHQDSQDFVLTYTSPDEVGVTVIFSSVISSNEEAYAFKIQDVNVALYKHGVLSQSVAASDSHRILTGVVTVGHTSTYNSFLGSISSLKIYKSAIDDISIMSDAYFHEPLNRENLLYYIPMTASSPNLVTTLLGAGVTSTIHALTTDDYLFWTDIRSITEEVEHRVLISEMESGFEVRRSVWSHPLRKWSFKPYHKLLSTVYDIVDFFNSKNGNEKSFLWRCPTDGLVYKVRFQDASLKAEASSLVMYELDINLKEVR